MTHAAQAHESGPATMFPRSRRTRSLLPSIALLLVLLAYGCFLYSRFAPAISTPDATGYWSQASLIAQTGHSWFTPEADSQFIGMHWLITPDGKYVSRYPPGLPVVVAAVYKLAGYKASVAVGPVLAILTLLGMYLLARKLVPPWWALSAVLLLMALPIFTQHALASESHMAVTFCLVCGTFLLLHWAGIPAEGSMASPGTASPRRRLPLALLTGFLLGMIPTIRYPEALLGLGIAVFVLWHAHRYPRIYLDYAAMAIGAAVPIGALLIRNQMLLGAFWRTGYSLTNEQTGFSWEYFRAHFFAYIRAIQGDGLGLAFVLGASGLVWMCATRRFRPLGIMLSLQSLLTVALYMAYYWGPAGGGMMGGNATMRFVMPLFPGFIAAGVWMLWSATQHAPASARTAIPLVICAIQFIWGANVAWTESSSLHYQQDVLARITDGLEKVAPRGDMVIASQHIQQHLDFVRQWKLVDLSPPRPGNPMRRFPANLSGAASDRPSPMQREKIVQRQTRYEDMDIDQRQQAIADDIMTWAGDHAIYFVGAATEMQQANSLLAGRGRFQIVSRVGLPEPPMVSNAGGPPGPGGPMGPGMGQPGAPGGMAGGPGGMGGALGNGPRGGPMGGPGGPPGGMFGGPDGMGGPPGPMPGQGPAGRNARAPFRGPGGMRGAGPLANQREAIIARWVPNGL